MTLIKSVLIFFLAGLCEIGGGYLIWLWLRGEKPFWMGILGGLVLFGYGIAATFQHAHFGRVYAAYGGIFVVMAILWGWKVDGIVPDKYDLVGGLIALIGMGIIMYAPRN